MKPQQLGLKELQPPEYTAEEKEKIIQYFMKLKGDLIRQFLEKHELLKSGIKSQLRLRILEHLDNGTLEYKDLVNFLDDVSPWEKQHVILLNGSETELRKWRHNTNIQSILIKSRFSRYWNARLPLILPKQISLSSIVYNEEFRELKIYAVERRDYLERFEDFDASDERDGKEVELRAYVKHVYRGVYTFKWNLISNTSTIQISQLPSGDKYEEAYEKFAGLINPLVNIEHFSKLDLRSVIKKLHELEDSGPKETRSHVIGYHTIDGKSLSAASATPYDSLLGERVFDQALRSVRDIGVGHIGNFYWLPSSINSNNNNPLIGEIHTIIVGNKSRINFTTPNRKEDVEYVLSRVRAFSQ